MMACLLRFRVDNDNCFVYLVRDFIGTPISSFHNSFLCFRPIPFCLIGKRIKTLVKLRNRTRAATSKSSFMGTKEEEEVRRLYGSGFAMKLATERRLASQMTVGSIGGGIPSSNNVMGDIISGRDMHIGFEDTLGLPEYRPVMNKTHEDPHMVMERKLGM